MLWEHCVTSQVMAAKETNEHLASRHLVVALAPFLKRPGKLSGLVFSGTFEQQAPGYKHLIIFLNLPEVDTPSKWTVQELSPYHYRRLEYICKNSKGSHWQSFVQNFNLFMEFQQKVFLIFTKKKYLTYINNCSSFA